MLIAVLSILGLMLGYVLLKIRIHNDEMDNEQDPDQDYHG
jgi:hypothetical protein